MMRDIKALISGWGVVETTAEITGLVEELRDNERRLRDEWCDLSPENADDALWRMVARGVKEAQAWRTNVKSLADLCERALKLRSGAAEAAERRFMRERARVLLHVLAPQQECPQTRADLMALWDEATRLEPFVRLNIDVARWRTSEDWLPFTGMSKALLFGPEPLPPGAETASPDDIPELVDEFLVFANSSKLMPEVIAAHSRHLLLYIHPFVDGNGHTSRMFLCDVLMRAGYGAPTLVSYIDCAHDRRGDWREMLRSVLNEGENPGKLVSFQLRTVLQAQARLA